MIMIKKFTSINNFAVFRNFVWDKNVKDDNGKVIDFKTINILYGRNYSGKTTLSRIVRALETGIISDKYKNPEFQVLFDDGSSINQSHINENTHEVRVFNEDFVKDNLSFLLDANNKGEIKPFAVLGKDNTKLQDEINEIKNKLGLKEVGQESGLYKVKKEKEEAYQKAKQNYNDAEQSLNSMLSKKATGDRTCSIKYKSDLFGDQNYNVQKLKTDINVVSSGYTPIDTHKYDEFISLIKENTKNVVPKIKKININILDISENTKSLVEKNVGNSQKIEELVRDAELNRWVKQGKDLHMERNVKVCAFCGNTITENRWELLDKHFDEESGKLENEISSLLKTLASYKNTFENGLGVNKSAFYPKFHAEIEQLEQEYDFVLKNNMLESITALEKQLKNRLDNLFTAQLFQPVNDYSKELDHIYNKYNEVETKSNDYSNKLNSEQSEARRQLRLLEVYNFIQEISYNDQLAHLINLKKTYEFENEEKVKIENEIRGLEKQIKDKYALMNDEEMGAKKIDEYLKKYFGHHYLSLRAKEETENESKRFRFEVLRNDEVAYNLSEGERSLIAFCYYMAKLEDINTYGKKPILWIDDPISSLDNNHVFFVYSLIVTKIANTDSFEQLFVSTHNLDFLGYLKRMNGKYLGKINKQKQYFCINRCFDESNITLMPNYLKKHITEFNYLFKEIFICSQSKIVDNDNYKSFYNFANNARKFLEIFLFYKYPDETEDRIKMERFFGEDSVPVIFTERINNEYSHLKENVSRGFSTIDVPEMNQVAKVIVDAVKKNDKEQYDALLNSIGYSNVNDEGNKKS